MINEKLVNLVNKYATFEKNWNGYDASPIPIAVIKESLNFIKLADSLLDKFSVYPTARDSVQFEHDTGNDYIEIEIMDNRYDLFHALNGDIEHEFNFTNMEDLIITIEQFQIKD